MRIWVKLNNRALSDNQSSAILNGMKTSDDAETLKHINNDRKIINL
jgi:hypothetical protein